MLLELNFLMKNKTYLWILDILEIKLDQFFLQHFKYLLAVDIN